MSNGKSESQTAGLPAARDHHGSDTGREGCLHRFLARHLAFDLQADQDMFATGLVNSLFALQLVMFVEQEFSICVEDDDLALDNFKSIHAILRFVERKLGASESY